MAIEKPALVERATRSTAPVHDHTVSKKCASDLQTFEPPIGIEPMTYALRVRRSNRLS